MRYGVWNTVRRVLRAVWGAIRARPKIFLAVALAVFLLDFSLPPLILSLVRKPWDHFSFNPWLSQLPTWVASPAVTIGRKVTFLSDVALFWFIASSPYDAPEWGFSAGVRDVARWVFMSLLFGAYFALWFYARAQIRGRGGRWNGSGRGGIAGALLSTLGLFTAPCSVAGCGAPVLPVLGLAFQGLTSGVLAGLATLSRVATVAVLVGMSAAVLTLGWLVSIDQVDTRDPAGGRSEGSPPGARRTGEENPDGLGSARV